MKYLAMLALAFATSIYASQEGSLVLSSLRLESAGIGSSGKVIVEGKQDQTNRLLTLTVTAFGKIYVVPKEKLASLADFHANGIRISYEAGYANLGGRTIYIHLQSGVASETWKEALITLVEDGKIDLKTTSTKMP